MEIPDLTRGTAGQIVNWGMFRLGRIAASTHLMVALGASVWMVVVSSCGSAAETPASTGPFSLTVPHALANEELEGIAELPLEVSLDSSAEESQMTGEGLRMRTNLVDPNNLSQPIESSAMAIEHQIDLDRIAPGENRVGVLILEVDGASLDQPVDGTFVVELDAVGSSGNPITLRQRRSFVADGSTVWVSAGSIDDVHRARSAALCAEAAVPTAEDVTPTADSSDC